MPLPPFKAALLLIALMIPCFGADPVAYTSLGAQAYLDTLDPQTGNIANRTAIAQNGTSLTFDNEGTPYTFSPDGKTAYIAGPSLEAINVATGASIWQIPDVYYPALATSVDGSLLYIATADESVFQVYAASSGQLLQSLPLPSGFYGQILVTPDNSQIYLSGYGVVVLSGSTYQVITTLLPRSISETMALSPDGTRLYVGGDDQAPNIAFVVDTSSDQVIAQINGSGIKSTFGQLTLTPDGKTLLFNNANGLAEASTATDKVTAFIQFPKVLTNGSILVTDNHFAYLLEFDSPGYYRFNLTAASVTHVANGGLGIGAARKPNGAVTILQNLNTVLTSDPVTDKVASNLGSVPGNRYLTLSGDGNTILGTSEDSDLYFSLIATATHKVSDITPIPILSPIIPYPVLSFDGDTAYYLSTVLPNATVSALNLSTGVAEEFFLPFTYGSYWVLAISPDGSNLYASTLSFMASMTCRVSLPAYVVGPCLDSGSYSAQSRPMAVSADDTKLYLPTGDGGVAELDSQTLALLRVVSGSLPPQYESNVVYSAAANSVYVATLNGAESQIVRVDLNTFQFAAMETLNFPPFDLAVTPDATKVLVVGGPSGTTVLDGTTLAPAGTIETGVTQSIVIAAQ
jgi:hypothetical protein